MFSAFWQFFEEMVMPQDHGVIALMIGGELVFDITVFGVGI